MQFQINLEGKWKTQRHVIFSHMMTGLEFDIKGRKKTDTVPSNARLSNETEDINLKKSSGPS